MCINKFTESQKAKQSLRRHCDPHLRERDFSLDGHTYSETTENSSTIKLPYSETTEKNDEPSYHKHVIAHDFINACWATSVLGLAVAASAGKGAGSSDLTPPPLPPPLLPPPPPGADLMATAFGHYL
jgi:hypothetical protein